MNRARRKSRAGIEPAHLRAPPRLRQSHIGTPHRMLDDPMLPEKRGLLAWLRGR